MAIAFYNPTSEDFYKKLNSSYDIDEKIDGCIENINFFLSIIQIFHILSVIWKIVKYDYFLESLKSYSKNLRRSSHFLRRTFFIDLFQKYPVSFRDCVSAVENRYFLMLSRSYTHNQ